MLHERAAGVLLHVTSLPGRFGIGDLGQPARQFLDFLERGGQRVWQVLPLSPTTEGHSPYSSYSAFASNPLLVDVDDLAHCGLLGDEELAQLNQSAVEPHANSDFELAAQVKLQALQSAFATFSEHGPDEIKTEFDEFCNQHAWWLSDFAMFAAMMKQFATTDWTTWPEDLVHRQPDALSRWQDENHADWQYEQFVQFVLYRQWHAIRENANSRGIRLFGDMPIFVAHGSADVWANQQGFHLDGRGYPSLVAGVPPDYFSKTGQLWGNPLYDWEHMRANEYRWWVQRLRSAFESFDLIRIDHFRGFEAYWEVPAKARTAVSGQWVTGPGAGPFEKATQELGDLPIVAEDLGLITQAVHDLRDQLGFPGMRVLQFGFDQEKDVYHRPEAYPENSVAYTGTHDNDTIIAWFESRRAKPVCQQLFTQYLGNSWREDPGHSETPALHWRLIDLVMRSAARLAIIPMQDVLGLGNEARMNLPGTADGNWGWRVKPDQLAHEVAAQLREVTERTGR